MKTIKFRESLSKLILKGEKNSTWRLFDDKDMYKTYGKYYNRKVDKNTKVKLIKFELV
ncbi:MAG: hypothetical protein AABW80_03155 [Nanoarchaeota archaeon]